jgi:hypothetical protein
MAGSRGTLLLEQGPNAGAVFATEHRPKAGSGQESQLRAPLVGGFREPVQQKNGSVVPAALFEHPEPPVTHRHRHLLHGVTLTIGPSPLAAGWPAHVDPPPLRLRTFDNQLQMSGRDRGKAIWGSDSIRAAADPRPALARLMGPGLSPISEYVT